MPKPPTNLNSYRGVLPYSSEIFGVYQPLLGWKSDRITGRVDGAAQVRSEVLLDHVGARVAPVVEATFDPAERTVDVTKLTPGNLDTGTALSGIVVSAVRTALPPESQYRPEIWQQVLSPDALSRALSGPVVQQAKALYLELTTPPGPHLTAATGGGAESATRALLRRESQVTGLLAQLRDRNFHGQLKNMFYGSLASRVDPLWDGLSGADPFDTLDPTKQLRRVGLSPVGLAHLFRQFFSEFDTFLGPPVGHIWIAPGSTVELIEVHTRRVLQEETLERSLETTTRAEKAQSVQDELSDAVKEDNRSGTKFGANVAANQHWGWGSADESASFSLENTQQRAREQIHTTKRDQSEKLTTEIKQNFKSTFRTVTETTDTSTKRYVLTNSSDELVNYELRRKMRQVGVQIQDIGSYLCWQTYVDDPADEIGLAKLVHVGAPPDLSKVPQPDMIVPPQPFTSDADLSVPFLSNDGAAKDDTFQNGSETSLGFLDGTNHIVADFPQGPFRCPQPGFKLTSVTVDTLGADATMSVRNVATTPTGEWTFTLHLDHVNFNDRDTLPVKVKLAWSPVFDQAVIDAENAKRIALFTEKERDLARQAFVAAAQERIALASRITRRKFEDLREEERIVVYRKLIQDLLTPAALVPQPDKETQHVVAELIDSIFDVDKMLYFVAPEWWRPRLHRSHQQLGSVEAVTDPNGKSIEYHRSIPREDVSAWGEADTRSDSYYITEDSVPARLGSSLGWLLQLDGDDQRNAFLNAPWVKAVMPIRPGKEKAAMSWLKHIEGTGTISDADLYLGPEPEWKGKTVFEVLDILATRVAAKHRESVTTTNFQDPIDDRSTVRATPVDRVYEHGFNPLKDGFRASTSGNFEIFDQWVEILPTDQVVAVPVRYDPKTGRQL
ncbi:hypothetical protein AB0C38_08355 [Amycolatopsis sp. NPDC048633]|uniref:hypothetical protein n=1 Tax=Amycolatopsis sp. NPDC048633 TaxID=3157095 RepID=UPI0033CB9034